MEISSQYGMPITHTLPPFLALGLSQNLEIIDVVRLASEPWGLLILSLHPGVEVTGVHCHLSISPWVLGISAPVLMVAQLTHFTDRMV